MKNFLYILITLLAVTSNYAQSAQGAMRLGNKSYEDKNYIQAEANYRISQSKSTENNLSEYNLGNALYQQKLTGEAITTYKRTLEHAESKSEKHQAYHNLGNAYLKEKKYKQAEEAYKNALRNNPKDDETRYNYALAKKLNEENPQQDQQDDQSEDNQDNQDKQDQQNKDQDDNKNNEQSDSGDNKDQKDDQDNKQDDKETDDKDNKDDGNSKQEEEQQKQQQASKEQMERMLDAINQEERNVQQRLLNKDKKDEGKEAVGSGTRKKDW